MIYRISYPVCCNVITSFFLFFNLKFIDMLYTAIILTDKGIYVPYLLKSTNLKQFNVIKFVSGQSEKQWFWASKAAEALNNLQP